MTESSRPASPVYLLPPPDMPNQCVHTDLFGPLPVSSNGNRWIVTLTCAFSQFVCVLALSNNEAATVTDAIMTYWIAVFRPMRCLCHD